MKTNAILMALEPSEKKMNKMSVKERSQIPLAIYGNLIFLMGFSLTTIFEIIRGTYLVGILSAAALFVFLLSIILLKKGSIQRSMYLDTAGILIAIAGIVFFLHDKTNMWEIYRSVAFIVVMAIFHQLFSLNIRQLRVFFLMVNIIWVAALIGLYIPYLKIDKIEALAAMVIGSVALIGANLAIVLIQQQSLELNKNIENEKLNAIHSFDKICKVIDQSAEGLAIGNELNDEVCRVGDNLKSIEELFKGLQENSALLKESSDAINEKSSQVMEKIHDMGSTVENQSVSLDRTSGAVASVTTKISDINAIAGSNKKSMDNIKNSLDQQLKNIQIISEEVEKVSDSSAEISRFVKTVESIASRTRLLAMNASIEASHAGGLGQGFSVIAKEIRKLSDETAKEADKISKKLQSNDEIVNETMVSARRCLDYAQGSSADISETVTAIQKIFSAIEEINKHTKNMQSELEAVVEESRQSNIIMEDSINAIVGQNQDIKNIYGASDDMNQKIAELNELITRIRFSIDTVHDKALVNSETTERINLSLKDR